MSTHLSFLEASALMPPLSKEPAPARFIKLDEKDTVQRHGFAGGANDKPAAPPGDAHVIPHGQNLVRCLPVGQVARPGCPVAIDRLVADERLIERTFEVPGIVGE